MRSAHFVGLTGTVATLVVMGCAETPPSAVDVEEVAGHPAAALSVQFDEGRKVEFFNIDGSVLVTEEGPAYGQPVLSSPEIARIQREGTLMDLFHFIKPTDEIPSVLADLQKVVTEAKTVAPSNDFADDFGEGNPLTDTARTISADGLETRQSAVLDGCYNGCCDPDWTFNSICAVPMNDKHFTWFNFNFGFSLVNLSNHTVSYSGTVCSAIGTSRYTVAIRGAGGSWDVTEAHFLNYQWWNWSSPRTTTAGVNSSGNQHMHMFCGGKRND